MENSFKCLIEDKEIKNTVNYIITETRKLNRNNITRTQAYLRFYLDNLEIKWSFLASMVSRNAGYYMTDLKSNLYRNVFSKEYRNRIFLTYEEGNWLIFDDAYPQLLLYEYSKKKKRPYFHLLKFFHVSTFMENEWNYFYKYKDGNRLMFSLIVNEQQMLQKGVVNNVFFRKNVFQSFPFIVQDLIGASTVLFPNRKGELFGLKVKHFGEVKERIKLGWNLSGILFHPNYYDSFLQYAIRTEHTGSRLDYERYSELGTFSDSPKLEEVYQTYHHIRTNFTDWYKSVNVKHQERKYIPLPKYIPKEISATFYKKSSLLKDTLFIEGELAGFFYKVTRRFLRNRK